MVYHKSSFLTMDHSLLLGSFSPSLPKQMTLSILPAALDTLKKQALLKKASDPLLLALLAYRSTPLKNGYSLAERLMCRKPCTTVSVVAEQARQRCPTVPYLIAKAMQQKPTYDRCHNVRSLDRSFSGDRLNAIEQDRRNRPAAMLFLVTSKRCPHHTMVHVTSNAN